MDAHYHKVMNSRDQIVDSGTRLYFAYSGVLDRQAFEKWKDEHSYQFFNLPVGEVACAKDFELIFDFPSRWWGGRVAGLYKKDGAEVFGRLFEIPVKDWPVVQHKEGVVTGMSIEITIQVQVNDTLKQATAFVTSPDRASTDGNVSARYVEALIAGANQAQLPADYIAKIRQLAK